MYRQLLILIIALVAYSDSALAQANPATGSKQAQTSPTPAATPIGVQQPNLKKEEDCACEAQPLPEVLAIVNGVEITSRDISSQLNQSVSQLQQQVVEARKRELDLQINSKLLEAEARKRKVSTIKLLEDEVVAKVKDPTDAEVQAFYEQNKARIRAELKDVRSDILVYLRNQREREEAQKLAERLRAAADVKVLVQNITPPKTPQERARVLATVNNEPITSEDIEDSLRPLIYSVQEQVYNLRQREIDLRINDVLLEQEAQKRKITTTALLDAEASSKTRKVTEADARAFYEENKERIGVEYPLVKDHVMQILQERETRNAQTDFAQQLRRTASIQTFLQKPEQPLYSIATDDQPSLGSQSAPVTIIEFTDLQCPSCAATHPLVEKLVKEHDGKVRLVVRDFPLEQHADAYKAAEAAEAAREQGKYWEYVPMLLKNQSKLDVASLKGYASQLALDRQKFDAALDSGKFADKVQRDIRDGLRLGVNGTPTFFVNGRKVSVPTFEALKATVETALKEVAKK
ncbi:MAG TPA: thioredoxin domain-containing protein [Pyrinomonadaceae bacterium]|jgi:protein-disulfide isomerase